MTEIETFVVESARGLYRWERNNGWGDRGRSSYEFENGESVSINPFADTNVGSSALWGMYATFVEYTTDDIAKVYVPRATEDDEMPTWFCEDEGMYLIHEGYLTPQ